MKTLRSLRSLLVPSLLGLAMQAALAQNIAPSASVALQFSDGGASHQKNLKSWSAKRFAGIVAQGMDYSCGASALATLLLALGVDTHEAQVVKGMLTEDNRDAVMQRGFSMLDMKTYVESIGLSASGFKVEVAKLYELKIPVIALVTQNNIAHFVVIKRASDGRIYLADPARGHRVLPEKEFEAIWSGLVLAVLGGAGYAEGTEILRKDPGALLWRETVAREGSFIPGGDHVYFKTSQF